MTSDPAVLLNRLVDTHWATAARHAWRQYKERGRGAIVFAVQDDRGSNDRTPLQYLTFTDPEAAEEGQFAKMWELVRSYEPEQQVVVAAVLPDGRTVFDVYQREPSPPEAAD